MPIHDSTDVAHHELAASLTALAQGVTASEDIDRSLLAVTSAVVDLIDGADSADILVISERGKHFRSYAATSSLSDRMDELQRQVGEGPCIDAATRVTVVRVDDLQNDRRWPRLSAAAIDSGVNSMLSFKLYTALGVLGALNILGTSAYAFDDHDDEIGLMLATNAAVALQLVNSREQFKSALASRDIIGQAKGMVMERFSVDAVQAFNLLTKLSQDTNVSVAEISIRLIEHGSLA